MKTNTYTPGPWKTLGDEHAGKVGNPWAAKRFIATHDAHFSGDSPASLDYLMSGAIICEMRDGDLGNADLIAAAPDLLAALRNACNVVEALLEECPNAPQFGATRWGQEAIAVSRAAISRAEGRDAK